MHSLIHRPRASRRAICALALALLPAVADAALPVLDPIYVDGLEDLDCSPIGPPSGFTRSATVTWTELTGGVDFPVMDAAQSSVPHSTGSGLVYLGASRGQYTSVQFTVPDNYAGPIQLVWDMSQIAGTMPQVAPGPDGPVTISRCPGDFRVGIATPIAATDFEGCKSIFLRAGAPVYRLQLNAEMSGISSDTVCGLRPGSVYYLNYTNANPLDGIASGEWTCPGNANSCGMMFRTH